MLYTSSIQNVLLHIIIWTSASPFRSIHLKFHCTICILATCIHSYSILVKIHHGQQSPDILGAASALKVGS